MEVFTVKPNRNQSGAYYADEAVDKNLKLRLPVEAGPHELAVTFLRKTSALPETERQPYQAHFNMDRHPRIQPAVYSVSITGPFEPGVATVTPSRDRIFVCRPSDPSAEADCAKKIVATLARRAYRRPVTDADLQAPLAFYNEARADGGFDAGIEMALRAILASTEFLFRVERDPKNIAPGTAYRVSDVELASRLSFFLWSSIPDQELLDLAVRGAAEGAGSSRARRHSGCWPILVRKRWSRTLRGSGCICRNLAASNPDARMFPDFDDNLRQAFRREIGAVLRKHRQGRPQRARSPAGGLHVRQRAAGQALRHPERLRQPIPARDARRRPASAEDCSVKAAFSP